jgi:hypothetical protein
MVRSKVTRLDPLGIKRVMDVGGPSAFKNAHKSVKNKTTKGKLIGKSTILTKEPKQTLRSRLRVVSDISSSENSESEMTSVWAGNKPPPTVVQHTQSEPIRAKPVSHVACPSGNQNVTVAADQHCSRGGTKPASSSRVPADPPNADEIAEDDDFTVIKAKRKPSKPKATPTATETAMNTALPSSPTLENQESGSSQHNMNQSLKHPDRKFLLWSFNFTSNVI